VTAPLEHPLVLGIPRGGVPVAAVVAARLDGDLDVLVTHKLGAPGNPEFAIGAVAADGSAVIDERILRALSIPDQYVEAERLRQLREVQSRARRFRGERPLPDMAGRTVVVVDDGIATGSTLEAGLRFVAHQDAAQVIAAVPVGPPDSIARIAGGADLVVCPLQPASFHAVGLWYDEFPQVSDDEVMRLLSPDGRMAE